jgi:hypothetical protein
MVIGKIHTPGAAGAENLINIKSQNGAKNGGQHYASVFLAAALSSSRQGSRTGRGSRPEI